MIKNSQQIYQYAKTRIPGGTHLLSKRPEMMLPEQWPNYYSKAKGAEIWDMEGKKYVDMCHNGVGACILGYADEDVNEAVKKAIDKGSTSTLNCIEEIELADELCAIHPWAEMVRYARTGGEAMAIAIRIARAKSRRDKVAFCGYHGWHDWYAAANLNDNKALDGHSIPGVQPLGVPRCLLGSALPFHYNKLEELKKIVEQNKDEIGVIAMEPIRNLKPDPEFIKGVRKIADENNIVLIFDEITAGWRVNDGGYHLNFDVTPDIAVFGKAMSNGFPMSAVIGTREVMREAENTFISSTYWTEKTGPVAALATIKKCKELNVVKRLDQVGRKVLGIWSRAAEKTGLKINISSEEVVPALAHFSFEYHDSDAIRTLFTQMMLSKGYLANNGYYATYSHTDAVIEQYAQVITQVFEELNEIIRVGKVEERLKGPVAHTSFKRLN